MRSLDGSAPESCPETGKRKRHLNPCTANGIEITFEDDAIETVVVAYAETVPFSVTSHTKPDTAIRTEIPVRKKCSCRSESSAVIRRQKPFKRSGIVRVAAKTTARHPAHHHVVNTVPVETAGRGKIADQLFCIHRKHETWMIPVRKNEFATFSRQAHRAASVRQIVSKNPSLPVIKYS